MIDPNIEKALAPSKEEWRYPLWTRLKNYAIGFGAALILVACIIGAIAYFMPPLAPQTELPKTAVVAPAKDQFVEPNKKVVKPNKKPDSEKKKEESKQVPPKAKPIDLSLIDAAPIPPSPPFPPN